MYRPMAMGTRGVVVSAHPLASLAGLDVLKKGGSASDAAITISAVLGVVQPHKCGIGGDAFFLIYSAEQDKISFINGSGRSPLQAGIDIVCERGYKRIPERGLMSVTVPGCVDSWGELWRKFGTMSFEELLSPALYFAQEGFPACRELVLALQKNKELVMQDDNLRQIFSSNGQVAKMGEVIKQKELASSFEIIAKEGTEAFYQGDIAQKIHEYMKNKKGLLTKDDLELHTSTWGEPIAVTYGDYNIYQTPPNTQGIASLLSFNIVEALNLLKMGCNTPELIHYLVEAKKAAYQYRDQYITDPDFVPVDYDIILDKQFAKRLCQMIYQNQATDDESRGKIFGDSVYFAVADKAGNVVSAIQSIADSFGSGCVVDETGIILQNRAASFSLDPSHINRLEPHKRTFHPLTASIVMYGKRPIIAFGTSGGDSQPQIHLQVLNKLLNFGYNIQEALEAPRWIHGTTTLGDHSAYLNMEGRFPMEVVGPLETWGHHIRMIDDWAEETGKAQGIFIDPETNVYYGGTDPRSEGYATAW